MVQPALIANLFEFLQIDQKELLELPVKLRQVLLSQNLPDTIVGVCGGGRCSADIAKIAEDVGCELAKRGAVIITGGRTGVMEAASRGAKSADGLSIGILPSGDDSEANAYLDVVVPTGWQEGRNYLIPFLSDAIIAIDGEYGTLSELAFALKLGKPIVGLFVGPNCPQEITRAQSPKEAVEYVFNILSQRPA